MKSAYEARTRLLLPRRTYTVVRVDGKAFHTYTRGCARPFDYDLMADMDETAKALCEQVQGCRLAYVQSDEITLVLTDFETETTDAWFDGNVQKITSISASIATAEFNRFRLLRQMYRQVGENLLADLAAHQGLDTVLRAGALAQFDSRVFTIPEREEVLIWRQQDAVRNSISMAAQAKFSAAELHGKNTSQLQELLFERHALNWNDYPVGARRGRVVARRSVFKPVEFTDKRTGELRTTEPVERSVWTIEEPPIFTQDREYLYALIPAH